MAPAIVVDNELLTLFGDISLSGEEADSMTVPATGDGTLRRRSLSLKPESIGEGATAFDQIPPHDIYHMSPAQWQDAMMDLITTSQSSQEFLSNAFNLANIPACRGKVISIVRQRLALTLAAISHACGVTPTYFKQEVMECIVQKRSSVELRRGVSRNESAVVDLLGEWGLLLQAIQTLSASKDEKVENACPTQNELVRAMVDRVQRVIFGVPSDDSPVEVGLR